MMIAYKPHSIASSREGAPEYNNNTHARALAYIQAETLANIYNTDLE